VLLNSHDFVAIAKIGKPFGLKGACNLFPIGETLLNSDPPVSLWIGNESSIEKIVLADIGGGKNSFYCFFKDCFDRDEAEKLKNFFLYIEKERLPKLEKGEFYFCDLIGISVETESGEKLGIVKDVFNYPTTDAIIIETDEGKEITIPFRKEIVKRVVLEESRMFIDRATIEDLML
jgi:16S rRNA processing protein RimM